MHKIKTFDDFEKHVGGDQKDLLKKVHIIGETTVTKKSPFKRISSLDETNGHPVLLCDNQNIINESNKIKNAFYNSMHFTRMNGQMSKFIGESFIPKTIKNRNGVKKLKFPIVATKKDGGETIYETYNKFKRSENNYSSFQEKIIPKTTYEALFFKNKPIHLIEKNNDSSNEIKLSKDIKKKLSKISNKIQEKYKFDASYIRVNENTLGSLFLEDFGKCNSLTESQANNLYIEIYEDYYDHKLPDWFKNKLRSL